MPDGLEQLFRIIPRPLACAILRAMTADRDIVERVARWLEKARVAVPAAFLLEAGAPLTYLAAQLAYLAAPTLGPRQSWEEVGQLLEDPEQVARLARRLQGEKTGS
jgi:hypothetical protein